jgi:hypothetical protein
MNRRRPGRGVIDEHPRAEAPVGVQLGLAAVRLVRTANFEAHWGLLRLLRRETKASWARDITYIRT